MDIDILVIGQGIAGSFLSYYLQRSGRSLVIVDESKLNTASKAAAGIINPVTGRRIVKTWMIDELLEFAKIAYSEIGKELHIQCISEHKIIDFFPSPQMRNAFTDRFNEDKGYVKLAEIENEWREAFTYDFGFGEIEPVYLIELSALLAAFRTKMISANCLLDEKLDFQELVIGEDKIRYKDIRADKIIFCDGTGSLDNPYFRNLPFAANKGEALVVELERSPGGDIYKKGINLVPWKEDLFWVGSSYEWGFSDDQPSEAFRLQTESILRQWLKIPFKVVGHLASIRPATLERRPFVGFHPINRNIGILNGMGTKGCSLAPYFAKQLVESINFPSILLPEVDIQRFNRILTRQ
jgi:glycine/D-amino acid oxidase-like deaminating enzyme